MHATCPGPVADMRSVSNPPHLVGLGIRFPNVTTAMREQIAWLAREIRNDEPRIGDITAFDEHVRIGFGDRPAILIGDTGEIPLMLEFERHRIDYRIGWLARDGDLVLVGGPTCPAFEAYQRRVLGQPDISYLHVELKTQGLRRPVPLICLRDETVYQKLLSWVRNSGGATLMAHITTGAIWALATRLSRDSGLPIHVAGPPPLLSRRVNNKLWFGVQATRLLGTGMAPSKREAQSISALTRHVMELSQRWDRLVIKVPDSAGSAGNVVLDSADLRVMSATEVCNRLRQELAYLGWPPPFPVVVEVWDYNVLTSPSVQLWIPEPGRPPVVEGIYEQVLEGAEKTFAGATEATLPKALDQAMATGGMQLALLFQALGYYGRCSFDAIAYGPDLARAKLHWIECNGRWGGVSVPMSLIDRLAGRPDRPAHFIVQNSDLPIRPRRFADLEAEFSDQTPPADLSSGVLFLTPDLFEEGAGCHFLCFGPTRSAAAMRSGSVLDDLQR